ncbi:MAG: efflux RND transporter periplasmic adaptor subunit [Candidatus Azobacteroides sp.]|nr:efflux RND transporter periplasmic adaptor subunit [Candidatus Azobacteroides sp.]
MICAIVLVLGIIAFVLIKNGSKEVQYTTVVAEEKTLQQTVTATGYVQPVDKVDVGTQVSGVIEKIYVDFNSQVKKGQLLAELDKSTLQEKLSQANASLSSSQSDLVFAQQNYDRIKQLYDVKAATQASYEDATNKLTQAKTAVINAQANLYQAKVNLSYAEIYSPIDGVVLNRAVEQGQTVASSFNTPTLFTIANDLTKMQVEADVDEADIGLVRIGQPVNFTVDAYSDDTFTGTVTQIRMQPTVTSNVVTYTVIVEAPNPDQKLYPGMTANIIIVTREEKGISIPTEALKFNPAADVAKHLNIKVVPDGKRKHRVWVKTADNNIACKEVKTDLNDGVDVIVTEGLNIGDTIVLSASMEKKAKKNQEGTPAANPFMPRRAGNSGSGNRRM